jgi:hypothetical protein
MNMFFAANEYINHGGGRVAANKDVCLYLAIKAEGIGVCAIDVY